MEIDREKLVFALSVDETIEWAIARTTYQRVGEILHKGEFKLPKEAQAFPTSETRSFDLHAFLAKHLGSMDRTLAKLKSKITVSQIEGIGVSSIGIINKDRNLLESIQRKPWKIHARLKGVADFGLLFRDSGFPKGAHVTTHNDGSAKCDAEMAALERDYVNRKGTMPTRLIYFLFDAGVNCGVFIGKTNLESDFHPEFGHVLPLLHPHDVEHFDPDFHSGCPSHHTCYEGIASAERIRRSWGMPWASGNDTARDVISFYIAQAIMTGILMIGPDLILLGGSVIRSDDQLLNNVRKWALHLNNHYDPKLDSTLEVMIQEARLGDEVRILASLEIARMSAFNQFRNNIVEMKRHAKS